MSVNRRLFLKTLGIGSAGAALASATKAEAKPRSPYTIYPEHRFGPDKLPYPGAKSALVIGGGIAGLSAALELAERGYRVVVRESDTVLGGRLQTRRKDTVIGDFAVEHGLHMWFDNYHVFRDIRARLGIDHNFREYGGVHFVFRDYEPEVLKSEPPVYPLNLVNLLRRSPNLNVLDGLGQLGLLRDVMFYNHQDNYERLDNLSFLDWIAKRNISKEFSDLFMIPAASVTLNDVSKISAAEMALYMHYYFIGQPRAMNREVTISDHGSSVISPWEDRLKELGVTIELGQPVAALKFSGGRALGELGGNDTYDWVVLSTDIPGTKAIIKNSQATDNYSEAALALLRNEVDVLKVAPPYKVLRVWFNRSLLSSRPDILETPQHPPINLLAQFHLLERESEDWAAKTGGSVIEFHLYANPMWAGIEDKDVWPMIRPIALEILPELEEAKALAYTVGSHHNFTSFEVGQGLYRPTVQAAEENGLENLFLAGDWVHTDFPTALMERAVVTGRQAANSICSRDGVRGAKITATSSHGPGII